MSSLHGAALQLCTNPPRKKQAWFSWSTSLGCLLSENLPHAPTFCLRLPFNVSSRLRTAQNLSSCLCLTQQDVKHNEGHQHRGLSPPIPPAQGTGTGTWRPKEPQDSGSATPGYPRLGQGCESHPVPFSSLLNALAAARSAAFPSESCANGGR